MNDLTPLRQEIDVIDNQITDLLIKRMGISHQIAEIKRASNIPVRDEAREKTLVAAIAERGQAKGVAPDFLVHLYDLILAESRRLQEKDLATK